MKKFYDKAILNIIYFKQEDVLTTSDEEPMGGLIGVDEEGDYVFVPDTW